MKSFFKRPFLHASVFFCLLLLLGSCGIPQLFYVETSLDKITVEDDTSVSAEFEVTDDESDNLDSVDSGEGPSLMLFYILDEANSTTFIAQGVDDGIQDAFEDEYYPSISNGKPVSPSTSDPVIVSYTASDDTTYDLYAFASEDGTQFSASEYIMYAEDPENPDLVFTLTSSLIEDDSTYEMELAATDGSYDFTYAATDGILRRYDGSSFLVSSSEIQSTDDEDYANVASSGSSTYYVYVFAAFCVKSDSFTNTFWTDLVYIGDISIDIDSEN
jgi:hypothetical protein